MKKCSKYVTKYQTSEQSVFLTYFYENRTVIILVICIEKSWRTVQSEPNGGYGGHLFILLISLTFQF